jgi:hypothetical protein
VRLIGVKPLTSAVGPGTLLVCIKEIDPRDEAILPEAKITVGAIYTLKDLVESRTHPGVFGYRLKERDGSYKDRFGNTYEYIGYYASRFRPLNDGDTSLVENEITIDDATSTKAPELV